MNDFTMKKLTFEDLIKHTLDRHTAGKPATQLDVALAKETLQNRMLKVIKRHGLMDVLLCDLELYGLFRACKNYKER